MHIVLIDDDAGTLSAVAALLRHMGHDVRDFVDPSQAVAELSRDTDLVVSDITMPVMDGFDVAEEVFAILGNHLPRVLFISGSLHHARLETYPPSSVIGIIPKPVRMAELSRVISLMAQSRTQCPGTLGSFCPHVQSAPGEQCGTASSAVGRCFTPQYATCPHYDTECGQALRLSIATASTGRIGTRATAP